jgi:ACR3 family arsenite efflux pump ArsB
MNIKIIFSRLIPKNLILAYIQVFYINNSAGKKSPSCLELIALFLILPCAIILLSYLFSNQNSIHLLINSNLISVGLPIFTGFYITYLLNLRDKYKLIENKINQSINYYDKQLMALSGMGVLYSIICIVFFTVLSHITYIHHPELAKLFFALVWYLVIMIGHTLLVILKRIFRDF